MSSQRTFPGYAKRRIEYQENAVSVVCTVLSATPATTYLAEIPVIVSHSSSSQSRTFQPRSWAAAPITIRTAAKTKSRLRRERFAGRSAAGAAVALTRERLVPAGRPRIIRFGLWARVADERRFLA